MAESAAALPELATVPWRPRASAESLRRRGLFWTGYTIVHVFEDSGRSGLRIDNRDGLQSLMLEVQSGTANFQAILVYDVSRWGRFQDVLTTSTFALARG